MKQEELPGQNSFLKTKQKKKMVTQPKQSMCENEYMTTFSNKIKRKDGLMINKKVVSILIYFCFIVDK
jgi:hypothetical protein